MNKRALLPVLFTALILVAGSALASSSLLTATVRPNPLSITIDAPADVLINQRFNISADILNRGADTIERSRVTLHAPRDVQTPRDVQIQRRQVHLGNLTTGETITVSWQARARNVGDFVMLVEATGDLADENISATDSSVVSATDSFALTLLRQIFNR